MSNDGHNSFSLDAVWMDMLRSLAILAVVIHHWLLFNPYSSSVRIFTNIADLIQTLAGTVVHLFFILSGCGLTVSYFKKGAVSWREWAKRRFRKIVAPYLIIVTATFVLANFMNFIFSNAVKTSFSPFSLLTYLTYTRNFYSPGWGLNPTLWFMPVIIGLYILFPFLVRTLKKTWTFAAPCDFRLDYLWFTSCLHRDRLPREPSIGIIFILRYRVFTWHLHRIPDSLLSRTAGSAFRFKDVLSWHCALCRLLVDSKVLVTRWGV